MSDYVVTKCIRLLTEYQDLQSILNYLNENELYKGLKEDYDDNEMLYEASEILEKENNIRIIKYQNKYYIDIILSNERDEMEVNFYMSLKEINKTIDNFIDKYGNVKMLDIIVLVHNWYNGCDEPYSY